MDPYIFLGFAAAYLVLLGWGVALTRRSGWWTPANLPLLVVAALVYDNLILGIGHLIGEGALLEGLNYARYIVHALVTPVLVAWALHALRRAGFEWAQARWYQVASIGAALALTVLEFFLEVRGLEIAPQEEYGVLSYASTEPPSGPPIMVLIVALVLVVVGAMVWKRQKWPWLFVGAVIMTIGSAVELPLESGAITNAFELVLLISIIATKGFQDRNDESVEGRRLAQLR
ncbi:MAG TPA: phospholipid phosphatase [Actinomycetales bacterium]|nr:phospholipid phosphatase [Actinomycetales bacterium]